MSSSWRNRFQGVRPASKVESVHVETNVEPATRAIEKPVSVTLTRRNEDPFREGEEVAVIVGHQQRTIHPPLIVDLLAFNLDNRASLAKRVKISNGEEFTISLLRLRDENMGKLSGRWQLYGVANETLCCSLTFSVHPSESWLLRTIEVADFSLYEGQSRGRRRSRRPSTNRRLSKLTPKTRKVDFRLLMNYARGLAGMSVEADVLFCSESGETLFRFSQELPDISPFELIEDALELVEGRGKLPCGRYELRLLLNGIEIKRLTYICENPNLFTAEGELSDEGRQLVIAGVTIARD